MEESVSEKFNCTICFKVPEKAIYQCRNGHMMCSGCSQNLLECPQCGVKMDSPKIRCSPLEDLLDMMTFDCANKSFGCTIKLKRYEIQGHLKSCTYSAHTIKLCEKLGYSCGFAIDTKSLPQAVTHLQTSHDFITRETSHIMINLEDFDSADSEKNSSYLPVVLNMTKENNKLFVLLNLISKTDNTISFVCLDISEDSIKNVDSEFTAYYSIRANNPLKTPHLTWSRIPLQTKHFDFEITEPMVKFSLSALRQNYSQDGVLEIKCFIQRNLKSKDVPEYTTVVCPLSICKPQTKEKENLELSLEKLQFLHGVPFGNEYTPSAPPIPATVEVSSENQFLPLPANFGTDVIFSKARCDTCKTKPIKRVRFKCLQCKDYDLCKHCFDLGKHTRHIFALIQNLDQETSFRTRWKRALAAPPVYRPEFSDDYNKLSPNTYLNCSTRNCLKKKTYVCLDCPFLVGYCKACFTNVRHDKNHCVVITETDKKLQLVAVLLFHRQDDDVIGYFAQFELI